MIQPAFFNELLYGLVALQIALHIFPYKHLLYHFYFIDVLNKSHKPNENIFRMCLVNGTCPELSDITQ